MQVIVNYSFGVNKKEYTRKVGLLVNRVIQMISDSLKKVKILSNKIAEFYYRHKTTLLLYSGVAATMYLFPNKIIRTLMPGFAWNIAFTKGNPLASDFLVSVQPPQQKPDTWVPFKSEEGVSTGLQTRQQLIEKALKVLRHPGPLGWVLLEGESRVGKSRMLKALSEKLASEGLPVYRLETTLLQSGASLSGMFDTRFLAIVSELKAKAQETGVTPVLVIDEIQSLLNVSHPGFNDCLKSGPNGLLGFNILAATNQPDTVKERDEALYRRFYSFYTLDPLDEKGVSHTLIQSKSGLFEAKTGVNVPDEVINQTTSSLWEKFSNPMDRVALTIQTACHCKGTGTLTQKDVEAQIELFT